MSKDTDKSLVRLENESLDKYLTRFENHQLDHYQNQHTRRFEREYLDKNLARFEQVLESMLLEKTMPALRIQQAMHYVLFPAGKRFRPRLVYACGELLQISTDILDVIAAAIELIHCYSLVHDDLPAMDNDDYRRGRLSCHRAFDEATAILVGDGMQALAIESLLTRLPQYLPAEKVIGVITILLQASGACGMVSGQSLDLSELQNPTISEAELKTIHDLKTGQLIQACVNMVLATTSVEQTVHHALQSFAQYLGLVFQMQDDYLDKYAAPESIGKDRSSDSANEKLTFAALYDQPSLRMLVEANYMKALESLSSLTQNSYPLIALIDELRHRMNELTST